MRRNRGVVAGAAGLLLATGGLVASGAFAAANKSAPKAVQATAVTVITGKPVPYAMQISRSTVRPGRVVFTVTNKGDVKYSFQVCPKGGNGDLCFYGWSTPDIQPGQTYKLEATLGKGQHEWILSAANYVTMKGLVLATPTAKAGSTTKVTPGKPTTTTTTPSGGKTTTTTPTTTPSAGGGKTPTPTPTPTPAPGGGAGGAAPGAALIGDPVAGAAVFKSAGCGGCHTLQAAGSTGTAGPNLDQIMPDQPTVVTNVTYGNAFGMPAFGGSNGTLSATQINNVAAYVYASTQSTAH